MTVDVILIESDNLVSVTGLANASTSTFINDATVTATLFDLGGNEVTGQTWPVSLGYVASSDGNYNGILSDDLVLDHKRKYRLKVVADGGPGQKRTWWLTAIARRGD